MVIPPWFQLAKIAAILQLDSTKGLFYFWYLSGMLD
jgi:hypothetical protein